MRNTRCDKAGMCVGGGGEAITLCNNAPDYLDYALPPSENVCIRKVSEHAPSMHDKYKDRYVKVSHKLDVVLSDPYLTGPRDNLDLIFASLDRELTDLIHDPELHEGDKGRYLYHIDARVLEAYLGAFRFRAEHGLDAKMPPEIIRATHLGMVDILDDFDGLYDNIVDQVALKRTEVEIPTLFLRTKDPDFFTFPSLFRENSSRTHDLNHDGYQLTDKGKTRVEVKNHDYRTKEGGLTSASYDAATVVAIHQEVVNLDFRDGETHITIVEPRVTEAGTEGNEPYAIYDERPRYVAWGASPKPFEDPVTTRMEYIQQLGGYRRDGLVDALVKEARGQKLSVNELNMLNGASHFLMATVLEKRKKGACNITEGDLP